MNKDLEIKFKSETGNSVSDGCVEAYRYRQFLQVRKEDLNSDQFEYYDGDYYLKFPDPNYIKWLEEKVLELLKRQS